VIGYDSATDFFPVAPPYIPGNGVAGTVISVGRDTDGRWDRRRVMAQPGGANPSVGYAGQAVVELIQVPEDGGLFDSAALLLHGATGLGLDESLPIQSGEWALLVGASGGLGAILLQLVRRAGGRVIGAARGKAKLDLAEQVGADLGVGCAEQAQVSSVVETGLNERIIRIHPRRVVSCNASPPPGVLSR
jgi:NADPH2:quinone reductase